MLVISHRKIFKPEVIKLHNQSNIVSHCISKKFINVLLYIIHKYRNDKFNFSFSLTRDILPMRFYTEINSSRRFKFKVDVYNKNFKDINRLKLKKIPRKKSRVTNKIKKYNLRISKIYKIYRNEVVDHFIIHKNRNAIKYLGKKVYHKQTKIKYLQNINRYRYLKKQMTFKLA